MDKIRINPGNIGDDDRVKAVVQACQQKNIPIPVSYTHLDVYKRQVFYQQLQDLAAAAQHNDEGVVDQLEKMIPTFTPTRKNLKT